MINTRKRIFTLVLVFLIAITMLGAVIAAGQAIINFDCLTCNTTIEQAPMPTLEPEIWEAIEEFEANS